jgi:metal-responsive CopG/Arc/MetJ family transcriptional regulator
VSTQIAVRLPDDLVVELDHLIASGAASSRASIVERALRRELRRYLAERDLQILQSTGDDEELADFTSWAASRFDAGD